MGSRLQHVAVGTLICLETEKYISTFNESISSYFQYLNELIHKQSSVINEMKKRKKKFKNLANKLIVHYGKPRSEIKQKITAIEMCSMKAENMIAAANEMMLLTKDHVEKYSRIIDDKRIKIEVFKKKNEDRKKQIKSKEEKLKTLNFNKMKKAALNGNVDEFKQLVGACKTINVTDDSGLTPLHIVASTGNTDCAEYSLTNFANMLARDKYGKTPIHYASNNIKMLKLFFKMGLGPKSLVQDNKGYTPLHTAIKANDIECVKFLINLGKKDKLPALSIKVQEALEMLNLKSAVDVNVRDVTGKNALFMATSNNNIEAMKLLLSEAIELNSQDVSGNTCLHIAARRGYESALKLLIYYGADVSVKNKKEQTPLLLAVQRDDFKLTEILIDEGAEVKVINCSGKTPIYYACKIGNVKMVRKLLTKGADIEIRYDNNMTVLHVAAISGKSELIEVLFEHINNLNEVDNFNKSCLDYAVKYRNSDCVKTLITLKAPYSKTLFGTMKNRNLKVLYFLLDNNANVNFIAEDGSTLLHKACLHGWPDVVRNLIERGAAVDIRDKKGHSPLFYACKYGFMDCVPVLMQKGAKSAYGICWEDSPFYQAALNNHNKIVIHFLQLQRGITEYLVNGQTAFQYALSKNHLNVTQMLMPTIPNNHHHHRMNALQNSVQQMNLNVRQNLSGQSLQYVPFIQYFPNALMRPNLR